VTSYSISPSLPAGLSFNTTTGVISGTPSASSLASNYTVTATNSGGSTTSVLSVAVVSAIAAPSSLSYYRTQTEVDFMTEEETVINMTVSDLILFSNQARWAEIINGVNTPHAMFPQVTGSVTSYSVFPSLPAGMSLNTSTGLISGTPTTNQGEINYTITATNSGGSTSTVLKINVNSPYTNITPTGAAVHNSTYVSLTNLGGSARLERLLASTDLGSNKNASSWYTTPLTGDFLVSLQVRPGVFSDGNNIKGIIGLNDTLSFNSPYSVKDVGWGIHFDGSTFQAKPWQITDTPFSFTRGSELTLIIKRINGVITFSLSNMDPILSHGNPNLVTSQWTHSITNSSTLYIVNHFQQGSLRIVYPKLSLN
jgi:hypothetical protein